MEAELSISSVYSMERPTSRSARVELNAALIIDRSSDKALAALDKTSHFNAAEFERETGYGVWPTLFFLS